MHERQRDRRPQVEGLRDARQHAPHLVLDDDLGTDRGAGPCRPTTIPAEPSRRVAAPRVDPGDQLLAGVAALGEADRRIDEPSRRPRRGSPTAPPRPAARPPSPATRTRSAPPRTRRGPTSCDPGGQRDLGTEQVDAGHARPVHRRAQLGGDVQLVRGAGSSARAATRTPSAAAPARCAPADGTGSAGPATVLPAPSPTSMSTSSCRAATPDADPRDDLALGVEQQGADPLPRRAGRRRRPTAVPAGSVTESGPKARITSHGTRTAATSRRSAR